MDANINTNTELLKHDRRDTFILDRSFILTNHKNLVIGMPYLYSEGNKSVAVRLLKVWVEDNIIYLDLKELTSPKTISLSWNLDYTGDYYLWTIADLPTLMKAIKTD